VDDPPPLGMQSIWVNQSHLCGLLSPRVDPTSEQQPDCRGGTRGRKVKGLTRRVRVRVRVDPHATQKTFLTVLVWVRVGVRLGLTPERGSGNAGLGIAIGRIPQGGY